MYDNIYHSIDLKKVSILVTGGAGFIGSNLVEYLVKYGIEKIRILDNFSTGSKDNLKMFKKLANVEVINGDIRDFEICSKCCKGIDFVLHQAALGSVPRSIKDPLLTNAVNINGFLNMLKAATDNSVKRFVYAASSSTYGDSNSLPKVEDVIGQPLSPYAVTKYVNELYASVFSRNYNIETIGLRYFNVFGPRQNPEGEYAAVIPLFIKAITENSVGYINGNGQQSRDFTYIENVIQANMLAISTTNPKAINQVFNVAFGESITLNEVWRKICTITRMSNMPIYRETRLGDIQHSLGNISKAKKLLNYRPKFNFDAGLADLLRNV